MSTRHPRTGRRIQRGGALAVVALLGAGLLGACSDQPAPDATDLVADAQARDYAQEQDQSQQVRNALRNLPQPTAGVVEVDGNRGSLTPDEIYRFNGSGTAVDARMTYNGEDQAFDELCAGQVDIVDSSRTISAEELQACHAVGLDVVQFQVAADAVVLAIKNETDVGGDCLSTDQVQEIYRAGSPVTRWSQLGAGYDDVKLEVGGPDPNNNAFSFFGQTVLDAPQPSLTNLRSDYHSFDTDQGSRLYVVGLDRDERLAALLKDRVRRRDLAKTQLESQWQVVNDAKSELEVARAEVVKGQRDGRDAATQASDQQRVVTAEQSLAAVQQRMFVLTRRKNAAVAAWETAAAAHKRVELTRGHLAYFRFSYYGLFEEQLRPFEITEPGGEVNCIFPSQQTIISGQYPLARRLLLTTTTRSLDRSEVKEFMLHYLNHATSQATAARLVTLPDADIAAQKDWVTGKAEPQLVTMSAGASTQGTTSSEQTAQPAR